MRNARQSGFTLIELMIAVTIIGILASIAVPAYRDYVIRTKVEEAASIFTQAKSAVMIYYSENGILPNRSTFLSGGVRGLSSDQSSYEGDYVDELGIYNDRVVWIRMKNIPELGQAANKWIAFDATASANDNRSVLVWNVRAWPVDPIPDKYLP